MTGPHSKFTEKEYERFSRMISIKERVEKIKGVYEYTLSKYGSSYEIRFSGMNMHVHFSFHCDYLSNDQMDRIEQVLSIAENSNPFMGYGICLNFH